MKLLCLSNGHGEDAVAVRILRELQQFPDAPEIAALPLVGEGRAYRELENVPIIGSVKQMPSGGFVYMDGRQLWRDVRSGLIGLTRAQDKAVRRWAKDGGTILAVGDVVPLLFAWRSGADYAFVGTAKSEYYLRDDVGWLRRRTFAERLEKWSGSVYLPWERCLMGNKRCQAVFPRDSLTSEILQKYSIPAFDLGNPMMDDLQEDPSKAKFYDPDAEQREVQRPLTVVLLPGSRAPEAFNNWQVIVSAVASLREALADRDILFLGAIAPGVDLEPLRHELEVYGWHAREGDRVPVSDPDALRFVQSNATFILTQHAFRDCLLKADFAIAMAGTATEQFVGLGKPAIAFPGQGPQYTPTFAEAQQRLLGSSLILLPRPDRVVEIAQQLLRDPDWLQAISENGRRRMGYPGASRRIATCLMERSIRPTAR